MKKNVVLLDGYNLIYRARYSGMNKGNYSTVFNFFRSLRPLIEKFSPDNCYFVLEGKPVKRLNMDPNYKGQRVYHDKDNFNEQRNIIIDILNKYFPVTIVKHENYECDDIIGYFANLHSKENVTIISSDTDFIQCINENISLYNPVRKKYIEKPEYDYVLWKSLKGDSSDNIEGFKGIGDKRAKKLCENKEELDSFLSKTGHREKLKNNLFMIKLHDLTTDASDIQYFSGPKRELWNDLKEVFKDFEFTSIVGKDVTWQKYINTFENLFTKKENI
jgi:DNA polymerase I